MIDENEVTAGHAASVGRVDPEEMYYLMSRGLHKEEAERLVIRGFLGSVLTAIPVEASSERISGSNRREVEWMISMQKRYAMIFLFLFQEVNDEPLVYLDNAATTQKPKQVFRH